MLAGLYTEGDGYADTVELTQAMAEGARQLGAKIYESCPVQQVKRLADGKWQVATPRGTLTTKHLVNCAGKLPHLRVILKQQT